jgi:hypothetical protein
MTAVEGPEPAFLISMDAEGDDLWRVPARVTTENARYLPRFQGLCERYGLRPTWLTNYEMAESPVFREFATDLLDRGTGEIGMHLHAWDSPPLTPRPSGQAYLTEYPEQVMRQKIEFMTGLLEERFGRRPLSHRAGRWGFDNRYARILLELDYRVDCSVTPHVSWASSIGDPAGSGGPDFTFFPTLPYFLDPERIDREGRSPLLEVPVTIVPTPQGNSWLRPQRGNLDSMITILHQAREAGWPCILFVLHSSELMPGGSPIFRTNDSIERLYEDLEALFSEASDGFRPATLSEFYELRSAALA